MVQGGGSVHHRNLFFPFSRFEVPKENEKQVLRACGAQDDSAPLLMGEKKKGNRRPVGAIMSQDGKKTMMASRLKTTMLRDNAHVLGVHHGKSLARVIHGRDE